MMNGVVNENVTNNIDGDINGVYDGNINGVVNGNILGIVNGNIRGTVNGNLMGVVNGDVEGIVNGNFTGIINGSINGRVTGMITGKILGNVYNSFHFTTDHDLKFRAEHSPTQAMPTTVHLNLAPGPLGVTVKKYRAVCVVVSKSNPLSPLEVNDTIISLNGIVLSDVDGELEAWTLLFSTFATGERRVVVERSHNAAAEYGQQPSIQEEQKQEKESTTVKAAEKAPPPVRLKNASDGNSSSLTLIALS